MEQVYRLYGSNEKEKKINEMLEEGWKIVSQAVACGGMHTTQIVVSVVFEREKK